MNSRQLVQLRAERLRPYPQCRPRCELALETDIAAATGGKLSRGFIQHPGLA
jgi:hypothetical protein